MEFDSPGDVGHGWLVVPAPGEVAGLFRLARAGPAGAVTDGEMRPSFAPVVAVCTVYSMTRTVTGGPSLLRAGSSSANDVPSASVLTGRSAKEAEARNRHRARIHRIGAGGNGRHGADPVFSSLTVRNSGLCVLPASSGCRSLPSGGHAERPGGGQGDYLV
jgi:hypothetical protein